MVAEPPATPGRQWLAAQENPSWRDVISREADAAAHGFELSWLDERVYGRKLDQLQV
jgi:hypothetical protein